VGVEKLGTENSGSDGTINMENRHKILLPIRIVLLFTGFFVSLSVAFGLADRGMPYKTAGVVLVIIALVSLCKGICVIADFVNKDRR
jgi:hypothetical protein